MCGIFGHIGYLPKELAQHCLDTLVHRGPDGQGLWHQPQVTLGHRRLAILDLSPQGQQPMAYGEGRYWITFNGEIYNFLEIRQQLETLGHRFRSDTDTEVVLAAFVEWGPACQDRFNGMWALAIWDDHEQRLFLSRDRFGIKPLFYASLPAGFAFASEMKALLPLLPDPRPNRALIDQPHRMFQYETTAECLVEGIQRFPAGHCAWYTAATPRPLQPQRWWCTLDHLVDVPESYEAQVEQFQALFLDACRLRMRSDVPIGTALSGGLDSSAVISAMAHIDQSSQLSHQRLSQDWQHAFVACFAGTPFDERRFARQVTDHLKIPATYIEIDPLAAVERLQDYFYRFEEIYLTSPIPFMLTYGAMQAQNVKVSIDGHGADELFAGYDFDYLTALQDARWDLAQMNDILEMRRANYPQDSHQYRLATRKWRFWLTWQSKRTAKRLLGRTPPPPERHHPLWDRLGPLNQQLYLSTHTTVLPTLLRNYDRYSMANGVEIRMPFMDYRVVSFAFSIPWWAKIRPPYSKAIIRDATAPFMPSTIAYRKSKVGFTSPTVDWIKGPLKSFFMDTLQSTAFRNCTLIDPERVSGLMRQLMDDPDVTFSFGEKAWRAISPYFWEQALLKRGG
ncbi:MAG: asparagine synthase (glutamine-hydrolyzing) [Cyanobacteria bacterium J06632_22]